MHTRNHHSKDDIQEYVSHVSHNSDYCPSCEPYIPPPHVSSSSSAHLTANHAHAQVSNSLSRNNSHNGNLNSTRTLIRDPVTNREISVHSRSESGNANYEHGCTCINPSACLCLLTAALLIIIGAFSSHAGLFGNLFTSQSSLLSSSSLTGSFANERVFKGQFLVTRGEPYDPRFEFPDSNHFKETAKRWTERLDALFNRSSSARTSTPSMLTKLFKRSEILALERGPKGAGSDDTLIHFNLHFKRIKHDANRDSVNNRDASSKDGDANNDPLNSASVYVVIATELLRMKSASARNTEHVFGKGVSIDQSSLDIEERRSNGNMPIAISGGHVSNPNWVRSGSSFPFFSGRSEASNTDNRLTNGRTSVGVSQPSWLEPRTRFPGLLEGLNEGNGQPGPRTCSPIQLALCQHTKDKSDIGDGRNYNSDIGISNGAYRTTIVSNNVSYNTTSWPNLVGHWNMSSLLDSVLMFRSLIDAECHPRAKDFICRLLQPECIARDTNSDKISSDTILNDNESVDDIPIYPCRDFCTEFWSGCGIFISDFISDAKIRDKMKCSNFPRFDKDPDDDNFQYIDEIYDKNNKDANRNIDKSKDKKVTRKRKEGRRCKNR